MSTTAEDTEGTEDTGFQLDVDGFDDRVVADPSTHPGGQGQPRFRQAASDTYRLVGARACPFAHRAIIVRRLLGLEDAVSLGMCGPTHDWKSWTFDLYEDSVDPVLGVGRLRDCYLHRHPGYTGGVTVPALVDIDSAAVITNDFPTLVTDFATEWTKFHRPGAPDLYPEHLRVEIDELSERMFSSVNVGVYRCGLADSQEAYDRAVDELFTMLDELEERLGRQRYLVGDQITLADVNLFATLIRFDMVYHGLFKCNRYTIAQKPNLWGYLRDLFQTPGFGDTVNFPQIKEHYYTVITQVNPSGIIACGPDPANFYTPHGRESLGGSPFGAGTAPEPPRSEDVLDGDERGAFV